MAACCRAVATGQPSRESISTSLDSRPASNGEARRKSSGSFQAWRRPNSSRFGSIHRNTYVQAPSVLDTTLAVKFVPNLWLAGQLSGVEGYLESAAGGLAAAFAVDRAVRGLVALPFPPETVLGSLLHYLAHASSKDFGPTNAMLGLLPPLPEGRWTSGA